MSVVTTDIHRTEEVCIHGCEDQGSSYGQETGLSNPSRKLLMLYLHMEFVCISGAGNLCMDVEPQMGSHGQDQRLRDRIVHSSKEATDATFVCTTLTGLPVQTG